jgi:hypothetical protein
MTSTSTFASTGRAREDGHDILEAGFREGRGVILGREVEAASGRRASSAPCQHSLLQA